jgi:hypothetical protein
MSRIVTQDKLNELTGMSVDLGRGGDCPSYKEMSIHYQYYLLLQDIFI